MNFFFVHVVKTARMDKLYESDEDVIQINISWFGCPGIELTDVEIKDVESLCDDILNVEDYFDDSDAWVMEFMLFQICFRDMSYILG